MRFLKFMFLFVFFVLGLMFFIQNAEVLTTPLQLKLKLFTTAEWSAREVPFYFVVVAAFGLGMLFTGILFLLSQTRLSFAFFRAKQRIKTLDKEVNRLASLVETHKTEHEQAKALEAAGATTKAS